MRATALFLFFLPLLGVAQSPFDFQELSYTNSVPSDLNNSRTAVVVNLKPQKSGGYLVASDWKAFGEEAHDYIYKMGVDAVVYVNLIDYLSGNSSKNFFLDLLASRGAKYIIFLNQTDQGFELICTAFNEEENLFGAGQSAYKGKGSTLKSIMLNFAREIKRTNQFSSNFLIPEKPFFADELPIVENLNLKNYPGQVRRSELAIEKFTQVPTPKNAPQETLNRINAYNETVDAKNTELEQILQELQRELKYDLKFIDYMSDEDLLRRRHQFLLRNVYATGESIRALLKYNGQSNSGYVSVIPIMPDNTTIKNIPKNALVHKFYIRQNIVKNIYVGEWDADLTWQDALRNYIRNMLQYFNKGN